MQRKKNHHSIKRRYLSLIEIMIVIMLIGLIGGVLAYNLRGSLDEGKAFRTRQGGTQLYNALMMEVACGVPLPEVVKEWPKIAGRSLTARKPQELLKDGWGADYDVVAGAEGTDILISSKAYQAYLVKKTGKENHEVVYFN